MFVNPARRENVVEEPLDPDTKTLLVLTSQLISSDPLRTKKLEFPAKSPFCVKDTARTFEVALVFLILINRVTYEKLNSFVAPSETFDDVTYGIADI